MMYNSISVNEMDQLYRKKPNTKILDVREEDEYANGHIPGATSMPLSSFSEHLEDLDKDKNYHVICFSGSRSGMACQLLASSGYQATNIIGGMSAWRGDVE